MPYRPIVDIFDENDSQGNSHYRKNKDQIVGVLTL
jgi:hypothetical protein